MSRSVILGACRTPVGRFRGALASLSAADLGSAVVAEAVRRAGVDSQQISEVILGNVLSAGVGQSPARLAALRAGLPPAIAALTVNKVCGSGLKAVMLADQAIRAGDADVIVAGGMESMSQAPYLAARDPAPMGDRTLIDSLLRDGLQCGTSGRLMGDLAEQIAESCAVSRDDQDEFAALSQQRAAAALAEHRFRDEIVPVTVSTRRGEAVIAEDESPRPDTTRDSLRRLPPVFRKDGSVTAGNSSPISDGAAAVVVASREAASQLPQKPLAEILAVATAHVRPDELFHAPVDAVRRVIERAGLTLADIDLFELSEAFAAQAVANLRELQIPLDRVNVNGGTISLGHPIGASGARVLVSLLYALQARRNRYGVAGLCLGGGGAVAMVVEHPGGTKS